MKTATAAALSSLFLSLISAAPLDKRGDVVWVTQTDIVVQTVFTTTTLWVEPSPSSVEAASATAVGGEFYEKPHYQQPSYSPPAAPSSVSVASVAPSSSQAPPAPVQTSSSLPPPAPPATSSVYVAPAAPSPESPKVSPTPPASSPAPAPVQSYQAPAPASSSPVAASSSSGSGKSYTGDMTYYDVGVGSCGYTNSPSEDVVAIDHAIMANGANPNANPLCGKTITIKYGGQTASAKIVDSCAGCKPNAIDVPPQLFKKVAPSGDGRVPGVEWWFD